MIIWERKISVYDRDIEEREDLAWRVTSPITYKTCEWANVGINIVAFLVTFYFFNFNILAHAVAFILLDAALCVVDRLVFMTFPSKHPANTELEAAQKRVLKLHKALEKARKMKDNARYGGFFYEIGIDEVRWLQDTIEDEDEFIEAELAKVQKIEAKTNQKVSKDYANKREYFIALQHKFNYFIAEYKYAFLNEICLEVKELVELLDKKPMGYEMIPHNLYLHLDELLVVLNKYTELDNEQKKNYISDIKKVSEYLKRNIEQLEKRISALETEDIEISLSVLLKDLAKGDDKDV